MKTCSQIIHAKWIIPCDEKNSVLENHALVLENGNILDVLPSKMVEEKYDTETISHYSTHAITPGFVNAHTHIPMNYFRGLADDLLLMDWLQGHIWPAEKKWLASDFVYDASLFAMAEMIRSGTTCFNDMFYFMPSIAKATEVACMRGFISMHFITFETNWAKNAEEEFEKAEMFYQEYKNSPYANITLGLHSLYTVTEEKYLRRAKEMADSRNLQMNMHVQEPKSEIDILHKQTKQRPLERLAALDMLNPRLIAIHMLHVNEHDSALLAKHKPHIVHCPQSNMKLSSGTCPVSALLEKGVNVALGTDSAASNNDLNMLGEMRTAAFLSKHMTENPTALSATHVLKMATINGAKALNLGHVIGSLEKGKSADFIAIHLEEIETLPLYHPISQIVYATSRQQVTDVWVKGKQLLKNRQLTTLDEKEIIAKAKMWGEKIKNG